MKVLPVEPLTATAFEPYGKVIETKGAKSFAINDGTTRRFHALASADPGEGGEAILSIFRAVAWPEPIVIAMLERHPLGAQAFIPLDRWPWLVVVAGGAQPSRCRAFIAQGDQGVQVAAGVWHHPLLVIRPEQEFLVVDRHGPGDAPGANLDEHRFAENEAPRLGPFPT